MPKLAKPDFAATPLLYGDCTEYRVTSVLEAFQHSLLCTIPTCLQGILESIRNGIFKSSYEVARSDVLQSNLPPASMNEKPLHFECCKMKASQEVENQSFTPDGLLNKACRSDRASVEFPVENGTAKCETKLLFSLLVE